MNKYQEAYNDIKENTIQATVNNKINYMTSGVIGVESLETIQELVDRATPKPLIEKWAWHCQTCGKGFVNHGGNKDNYCSNCGQRLTEKK